VVDGNVIRVLSRVFGIETAFDTTAGKREFAELAQQLIDAKDPGLYNQAIMDFGAVICTPQNPKCDECPFNKGCVAFNSETIEELPFREKKTKIASRFFNYVVINNEKEIFIRKRTGNDIWKNLYEFPMIETKRSIKGNFSASISRFLDTQDFSIESCSKEISQMLSHRKIHFRFVHVKAQNLSALRVPGARRVKLKSLSQLAFPKTLHLYLKENYLL
jgi:A/G-specific adenine glycosylase